MEIVSVVYIAAGHNAKVVSRFYIHRHSTEEGKVL
jgi:hypothetical protein